MPPITPRSAPVTTTSTGTSAAQKEPPVRMKENPAAPKPEPQPEAKALAVYQNLPGLPDYLSGEVSTSGPAAGLENAAGSGLQIPMLLIAQGQGSATQDHHRTTGDVYLSTDPSTAFFTSSGSIRFVPFFHYMEYILWAPRNQGGGMVDRSKDQKGNLAILAQQHLARRMKISPEERNGLEECVSYHVFLILPYMKVEGGEVLVRENPIALPLSRSKFKTGNRILQLAKMRAVTAPDGQRVTPPLYAGKYNLSVVGEVSKRGSFKYQNFAVDNAGWVSAEELAWTKKAYEKARAEFAELQLALTAEHEEEAPAQSAPSEF